MVDTRPASPKQVKFIETLAEERELSSEHMVRLRNSLATMTIPLASETIKWLMAQPKMQAAKPEQPATTVQAGHYAIPGNDGNAEHDIRFYRVDKPKAPSKWAGYTFVKVQSSDMWYRVGKAEAARVLSVIEQDPHAAQMLFAEKKTRCYTCNRALTDATSRERGQGPECASK